MNKGLPLGGGLLGQMAATPHCVGRAKQRCPYSEPPANCSTLTAAVLQQFVGVQGQERVPCLGGRLAKYFLTSTPCP